MDASDRNIGEPLSFDAAEALGSKLMERFNLRHVDLLDCTASGRGFIPMVRVTVEQAQAQVGVEFVPMEASLEAGVAHLRGYEVEGGLLEVVVPFTSFTVDRLALSKERRDPKQMHVVTPCGCVGPHEVHGTMKGANDRRLTYRLCPRNVPGHPRGLIYDQDGHVIAIEVGADGKITFPHACNIGGRRCGGYTRHYAN